MIKVSVVVCTYNREKYIGETLEHLVNQSSSKELYEVIIINNNSTDGTEEICQKLIKRHPGVNWEYINEKNQGHTFARNAGIKASSGALIAFIDDDAFVEGNYVEEIIDFFSKHPKVKAAGGKITPRYETSEPEWMSPYLLPLVSALDMGIRPKPFKRGKFPIGANMVYREAVFREYGTFDVNFGRRGTGLEGGDEKELIYRLQDKAEQVYYVPAIHVSHIIPGRRLQMDYIKGLAEGVARSEKKRIAKYGGKKALLKVLEESVKTGGTIILALLYFLKFNFSKGFMLIKFRFWVLKKYLF